MKDLNRFSFAKQMSWYLFGSAIPMLIGFIKTPILTDYFKPSELGYLGIVTTSFSYFTVLSFYWIISCVWRFFKRFEGSGNLKSFYSTILHLYIGSSILLFIISAIFYLFTDNQTLKNLIVLAAFWYTIKEFNSIYLIILRIKGEAKRYNLFTITITICNFLLLLFLMFYKNWRIEAVFSSALVIDCILLILIFFMDRKKEFSLFSISTVETRVIKIFFRYAGATIILDLLLTLIASSDRYMVLWFDSVENVGIYDQSYRIAEISIMAIGTVYFSTISPNLIQQLSTNKPDVNSHIQKYLNAVFVIGLPIVFLCSLYSQQIANILLNKEFKQGYIIMPYVFFSAILIVIFKFHNVKFKFTKRIHYLNLFLGLTFLVNILFNIIFIPVYGYLAAAVGSLFSYLFLVISMYIIDGLGFTKNKTILKNLLKVLAVLCVFVVVNYILKSYIKWECFFIIEGAGFIMIYFLVFKKSILGIDIPMNSK